MKLLFRFLFLSLAIVFASCNEPSFTQPQGMDGKKKEKFPLRVRGKWKGKNEQDSARLVISKDRCILESYGFRSKKTKQLLRDKRYYLDGGKLFTDRPKDVHFNLDKNSHPLELRYQIKEDYIHFWDIETYMDFEICDGLFPVKKGRDIFVNQQGDDGSWTVVSLEKNKGEVIARVLQAKDLKVLGMNHSKNDLIKTQLTFEQLVQLKNTGGFSDTLLNTGKFPE